MPTPAANGQHHAEALWQQTCLALQQQAWPEAEGLLWRLWTLVTAPGWELRDVLGYCLLMQGSYGLAEQVLRPALEASDRSFWVSHKLGDALRGLNRPSEAAALYRRSAAEGSDSPLTARNLLQVLQQLGPAHGLEQLAQWQQAADTPAAFWAGACEAALLLPTCEVAQWLWQHGRSDGPCRRRLLEAACYGLELDRCWQILGTTAAPTTWERALSQRLQGLGLLATDASPAAGE
jgi:hypothetical protein